MFLAGDHHFLFRLSTTFRADSFTVLFFDAHNRALLDYFGGDSR